MEFLDKIKQQIPEFAKDIKLNLDAVINRSTLSPQQAIGCALAAAVSTGNNLVANMVAQGLQNNPTEHNAALCAAAIMAQNNAWYPYVEMTGDANLKGLPAQLRMNAIINHGGTSKSNFEAYSLAASIVGKCHFCVKAHYDTLKQEGYSTENLRDIGRVAAVVNALAKVIH